MSADPKRNRRIIFGAGFRRGPVTYAMKVLIVMKLFGAWLAGFLRWRISIPLILCHCVTYQEESK